MLLKIIKINDKRLRIKNNFIFFFNKIKKIFLIKRILFTMYEKDGVGISATQINNNKKIIIIDVKKQKPIIMINSIILKNNKLYTLSTEGCLSIENFYLNIARPEKIIVKFINLFNKIKKKIFNNIISRCIQHENDHLNSILIIDYNNKIILYE
ncbi:peptide deformylase [Candidatus Carsonella ruddii]|uniref:peptide deformylase n=1 Tax=Carsonella ruddii TaxID=114186 RepID=UPI003D439614